MVFSFWFEGIAQVNSMLMGLCGRGDSAVISCLPRRNASLSAEGYFCISPRSSTLLINKFAA